MRESAYCVATSVHVRLWNAHTKLCNEFSDDATRKSQLMVSLQNEVNIDAATRVAKNLELLAEFPRPSSCHTAQFVRLLLGHTNTCITLLTAVQNHEVQYFIDEISCSPFCG